MIVSATAFLATLICLVTGQPPTRLFGDSVFCIGTPSAYGTGIAVTDHHIITAHHVVKDFKTVTVYYRREGFLKAIVGRVVAIDQDSDSAVVEVAVTIKPVKVAKQKPQVLETVYNLSFTNFQFVARTGHYWYDLPVFSMWKYYAHYNNVQVSWLLTVPGNSGGGLFNSRFELVGLLIATNPNRYETYSIDICDTVLKGGENVKVQDQGFGKTYKI